MAYTDVITLEDAKTYLGVDDTSRDAEIVRMIKASLSYLEKRTNIIMYARDKEYVYHNGCVKVYDAPINTSDVDAPRANKGLYSIFTQDNEDVLTLNVGDNSSVPSEVLEAAFMLIEYYFNDKEGSATRIPEQVEMIIQTNKRFVI